MTGAEPQEDVAAAVRRHGADVVPASEVTIVADVLAASTLRARSASEGREDMVVPGTAAPPGRMVVRLG
jgi:hypothetical protein